MPFAPRPRPPHTLTLPAHISPRIVCPLFDSRQEATAFNQPLSFETSSVTTNVNEDGFAGMTNMFGVRSAQAL